MDAQIEDNVFRYATFGISNHLQDGGHASRSCEAACGEKMELHHHCSFPLNMK